MRIVENPPVQDIEDFCMICETMGYDNNNSLKSMKYEWCLNEGGMWWGVYDKDYIVSVAGCHPFKDGWRMVFRGVQIQSASNGLSKTHMTSIPWSIIMPASLAWANCNESNPAYITTNISHDASGKMNRIHRVLRNLAKQDIVKWVSDEELFYVMQSVWKLDLDNFRKSLIVNE